ncbi:MAG: sigma 54-interacting transcriptional regulator [Clostridium luticellarii]|uniref:sigma 54-interacting transcriptional regulator n=1 Tax=Clostridium luticellarii TaxID=1691940 RepID=UPI002355A83B|nr:sigma 54-interacting transcriptional regulator [Clostridium luticellarii]MCI2040358.1 sigma 54-interacting transcriptional regulator [Clostridium luticellarii]
MKNILIIAPHFKIEYTAKKVAARYNDVDVKLALLNQSIKIARLAEKEGVEAIISRGGTASIIENTVQSVPVIKMEVSPYDLINAVYTAKKYGSNIFIIGFQNIIEGVGLLRKILNVNIHIYYINDEHDGERYIKNLINSGEKIDVILGGTVAENLALKYNIPTVLLETSAVTVDSSIKEARRIIKSTRKEKQKTEQFKAILNYISEGVVSIDYTKRVITFNSAASKMLGIPIEKALGHPVDELIPNTMLPEVLNQTESELGQLFQIGKTQIVTNRVPVIINNKTVGAVETFQHITKIQEYEEKIRGKLLYKGNIAKYSFSEIIGESEALIKTKERAKMYAGTDSTVLIVGESGVGKEMFAQAIHLESRRKKGPFVAVNCTAISQNLLESELFGYDEGAFTGAKKAGKAGLFTEAHGGTIFLDEVEDIDIELQGKLLRVIQEREVRPVGSNRVIPIDIRIIAATNKNLLIEVENGKFRRDLYYRLDVLRLKVPSLRDRGKDDIKLLSSYFEDKISSRYNKKSVKISNDALDKLQHYHWPGNIRELENIIESLVVLNDSVITGEDVEKIIDEKLEGKNSECEENNSDHTDDLEEVKKRHINKVLDECRGNRTLAASRLGISRTQLWRILNDK